MLEAEDDRKPPRADDAVAGRVGAGAAAPLRRRVRKSGQCWRLRARGLVAQQLPPALQEQRAVVELDCQQVALAEPLPGKQAVADLRCVDRKSTRLNSSH